MKKQDDFKTVLLSLDGDRNPKLDKRDKMIVLVLTVVYLIMTVLNLGTLNFPTESWRGEPGDEVVFDFGYEQTVSKLWFNGNIANGQLNMTGDDGIMLTYNQDFGNMFEWSEFNLNMKTRYIHLSVAQTVAFNELAFFGPSGELLTVTASDNGAALVDEQSTVPDAPTYFNGMYFDEIYHARTAYENIHNMSIYEWTHPPLGKLIIAVGILIFGMTPFGWRIMGALFGVGMLPILYVFAKRIFKRTDYALVATGLFMFDCMHFTQTRIATIDVYAVFFIMLMFFYMYEYISLDFFTAPFKQGVKYLALSGLFFGLGVASKWIGCYAGVGLAVLLFGYLILNFAQYIDAKTKEEKERTANYWGRLLATLGVCVGFFVVIPALIYFAAYTPYYRFDATKVENYGIKDCIATLIKNQKDMYNYHSGLDSTHQCQSTWYQWPFTSKSVWFYVRGSESGISNISSTGNPAVWWGGTIATLCLVVNRLIGKIKKGNAALSTLLVAILANYLPWVLVTRCVFLYHFFATVPFLILAGVYFFYNLEERKPNTKWLKWIWLGVAILFFILMYPAISGLPTSRAYAYFVEYWLPGGWMYYGWV